MLLCGDSAEVLQTFPDNHFDLTVTSPPYDDMRSYNGNYNFNFEEIAKQLFRVTKQNGVICWIVNDRTVDGDESGTSFRQALYFKQIGFKLNDTMIIGRTGFCIPSNQKLGRYHQTFEYCFILSKGKPKTFNPIRDKPNKTAGKSYTNRHKRNHNNDILVYGGSGYTTKEFGMRYNIWNIGSRSLSKDISSSNHPAIMDRKLTEDLIKSWSNEGDLVLDPFMGSGTVPIAAQNLHREYIGIEINPDYFKIAESRIAPYLTQTKLI